MPGVRVGRGAVIQAKPKLMRNAPPFANVGAVPRGRQIGWRRPRRTGPRHDPASAETLGDRIASQREDVYIREVVDPNDRPTTEAVIDLRPEAFREGVTVGAGVFAADGSCPSRCLQRSLGDTRIIR